jgi:nucleoside-diphosphate-sugar epimerase
MSGASSYIQQSIVMAYPDMGDEWIDESMPLDAAPERAMICGPVIAMEEMVRRIPLDRTRWTILRGGMFVGPGTMQEKRIEAIRAGTARVPGDGMNFLPLVHVADMAEAVVAAARHGLAGATLNIVDDPLREGEYCDRLADLVGAPHPPRDRSLPRPPSWRCSNDAARARIDWEPRHSVVG